MPVPADDPAPGTEDVPGLGAVDWLGVGVGDAGPGEVLLGCVDGDWLGVGLWLGTMAG